MTVQQPPMTHTLTLQDRSALTMTGVNEVIRFDQQAVVLRTELGVLAVHGTQLQLKTLSPEGGRVAVDGKICAMIYEEPRQTRSFWQRLLR